LKNYSVEDFSLIRAAMKIQLDVQQSAWLMRIQERRRYGGQENAIEFPANKAI
jgi:hypothetical protein